MVVLTCISVASVILYNLLFSLNISKYFHVLANNPETGKGSSNLFTQIQENDAQFRTWIKSDNNDISIDRKDGLGCTLPPDAFKNILVPFRATPL